ncbi:MAG: hypothetical protein RL341_1353 [Pseudomonadota bacterium]
MKVFDLACEHGHAFEGWFASHEAFEDQLAKELIECSVCASRSVARQLSAPRLNLAHAQPPRDAESAGRQEVVSSSMQAQLLKMMREYVANTENVGEKFAEEARKIHYGEAHERSIRGSATHEERQELAEEGIETFALPVPRFLTEPSQ